MKNLLVILILLTSNVLMAQNVKLSTTVINFGDIPMKPKSEKNFTLYNRSTTPMVINAVNVDCNCTQIQWSKKPIIAGDSTVIKVIYIPAEMGVFYKKIKVITSNGSEQVTIRGRVQ